MMRRRGRSLVVMAAVLGCLVSGTAAAQERKTDTTMDVLREKVQADKKLIVALTLELSDDEAKKFWPVYGAYQSDMITHHDRVATLLGTYAKEYPSLSDETAKKLVTDFVALESDHADLLKRYLPRFQGVLPARKVARFYQLENKIRALLSYELAREIPFVK
jgi:hypothetical protein